MKGSRLPLLIYLNSNGEEIDRILGALPPEQYLKRIEDIYNSQYFIEQKIKFENSQNEEKL